MYLITVGEGWVFHSDQKFLLKPGFLYLIPSFTHSRYHCDAQLEQYFVHVLDELPTGVSVFETAAFNYEVPATPIDQLLLARLLALNPGRNLSRYDPRQYDNQPELLSFNRPRTTQTEKDFLETQGILLQLISRFLSTESRSEPRSKKPLRQLGTVLQYIHQHLHEPLSVESLAAAQHQNPDYFSRHFLDVVGVRPTEYIINKRLERAQRLLTLTNVPLKEIAERVGVPNVYYFSRLFRRRFNLPPATYRRMAWRV
ncbi:MAG: helix-turn-helix transcriptional regulator [Sphingobacteriaceae bacterium]|nr:helix-turn-helix transcriptional regulator [Cytophagaceae bacterium]